MSEGVISTAASACLSASYRATAAAEARVTLAVPNGQPATP